MAFGKLIKPYVLDAVPMVNVHFSLLPRWRGAAPVERAILAGDDKTGVCLMRVDVGLDTGDVFARRELRIDDEISAAALTAELATIGAALLVLVTVLADQFAAGSIAWLLTAGVLLPLSLVLAYVVAPDLLRRFGRARP